MAVVVYAFMDVVLSNHRCSSQAGLIPILCCFRFDIVIDEDLRPWLLEVNYSPDMARRTGVDKKVQRYIFGTHLIVAVSGFKRKPQKDVSLAWQ